MSLDLRSHSATYAWSDLKTCISGESDSGGDATASEVWLQTPTLRRRLVNSCTAYGVFGSTWIGSQVWWLRQTPPPAPPASDQLESDAGTSPLPAYTSGAALVGNELFISRGTLSGPSQIVAIAAPEANSGGYPL